MQIYKWEQQLKKNPVDYTNCSAIGYIPLASVVETVHLKYL